jgi:hypothetical protein
MLSIMVKSTGVGIPLNALVKKSGVELETKPKYYQGLSVGGKKRADWAQAPGERSHVVEERIPPVSIKFPYVFAFSKAILKTPFPSEVKLTWAL